MSKKALSLVLVFSLAFNVAFVGIWGYNRVHGTRGEHSRRGHRSSGQSRSRRGSFWAQLKLPEGAQKKLEEQWRENRKKMEPIVADIRRQRAKLFDLLAADPVDRQAVAELQEQMEANQRKIRQLVLEQMIRTRDLLTPEQRSRWAEAMKAFGERSSRRARPTSRPAGGARPASAAGAKPSGPTGASAQPVPESQ